MDDLISEFITETAESLALLDSELVKLEQNPNDQQILGNIFRLVHTIKGTCGFLGLPRLESVAHAGENVLGKIRDATMEVTPGAITIVLEALDRIKSIMDHLAEHGEEPQGSDAELIDRLNQFAEHGTLAEPTAHVLPEAPDPEAPVEEEIDELERLFRETQPTIPGGADAPAEAMLPVAAAPAPAPKSELATQVKEKAIEQGLAIEAKDNAGGAAGAAQSIRVNLDVLENLMQMVGELVLTRNQLMQFVRARDDNELKVPLQALSHITTELQEAVMKTRMQPISNAWSKFPRLIRDLSHELGKKIDLRMVGAETELDRQLLEMIKDPLTHMVRNSCDHGLEMPADRAAHGKPETGTVTLSAFHEGGHIIIEIADDGRGVNLARVKQKAIENGLATEDELAAMSEAQIIQFIFKAGFSTAEKVTSVSGRGVGMDVVRTNIEKIGGTVELSSESGKGSTFHIKIPLTLAIVSVLIVKAGGERFALPQINVLELVRTARDSEYQIETISQAQVLRLRDRLLPLLSLGQVLGLPPEPRDEQDEFFDESEHYIVVCKVGGTEFGLIVDHIFDTEEIVVKPVSVLLKEIPVYSGNTILGDGSVIMILDPNGLARSVGDLDNGSAGEDAHQANRASAERSVSFLLFKAGEGAPKAVPLELVSRLEEIEVSQIEYSGGYPVIQYRSQLMRLTTLPGANLPQAGRCDVVVFTYDGQTVGLVVDDIIDILEASLTLKMSSSEEAYLGSMVMAGKTTDVVDVGYVLKDLVQHRAPTELVARHGAAAPLRLMLVEDSPFFRKLTVPYLESVGYEVNSFADGIAALAELSHATKPYDVIVTDIEMPEMDGFEFATKARELGYVRNTPILAFTSTINANFAMRGQQAGIHDVILKTDREALVQAISKRLTPLVEAA